MYLLGFLILYPFVKHALVVPWMLEYEGGDFTIYYKAAERLAAGRSPYPMKEIENARDDETSPIWGEYPYPPLLARVLVPLTSLPVLWAKRAYIAVCLLCFFIAIARFPVARLRSRLGFWAVLAILLGWGPFIYSVRLGQCELLAIPLIAVAWKWLAEPDKGGGVSSTRNIQWAAGVLLGVAAMVRVTPVLMLPLFLVCFRWRITVGFVAGALGSLILSGPGSSYVFFTEVLPTMKDVSGMRHCPAFHVLFLRLVDRWASATDNPGYWIDHAGLIGIGASGLFYLSTLVFVYRYRNRLSDCRLALIGCYLAPLLAGKNPHHYTLALFPVLAATIPVVGTCRQGHVDGRGGEERNRDGNRWWLLPVWALMLIPCFNYWWPCQVLTEALAGLSGLSGNVLFILGNVGAFVLAFFVFVRYDRILDPP